MKNGILLSGGTGTRLQPLTHVVNKHLLGVNGKFIIDYPINTLKQMGVENITVIMGGNHFSQVVSYLQDGSRYGMNFNYVYQGEAKGIAQAINLCQRQVSDDDKFAVVLGDNVFENPVVWNNQTDAEIVLHKHPELTRFGVATINRDKIFRIQEKPTEIDAQYDNYAIAGCYSFSNEYFDFFKHLKPSKRGEYEITDIINMYNEVERLSYTTVDGLWSDVGTHESIAYVNDYFYNKNKSVDIE